MEVVRAITKIIIIKAGMQETREMQKLEVSVFLKDMLSQEVLAMLTREGEVTSFLKVFVVRTHQ